PDQFPFGAGRDDPGDGGNGHFLCSSRLWKSILLLRGGECAETEGDRRRNLEFHRFCTRADAALKREVQRASVASGFAGSSSLSTTCSFPYTSASAGPSSFQQCRCPPSSRWRCDDHRR